MQSHFSCVFVILWTVDFQAPLSMGFSRQWYWSGLPCPPPGDLPDPRMEPVSLASPVFCIGRWIFTCICVCVSVYVYIHMFYFVFKSFRILEQLSNMNVAFSPLMMWCGDPSFCQQLFPWVKRWSVAYQRPRRAFEAVRYHYQSWSQDCVFEGIKHAGDGQMQVTGTVALP